MTGSPRWPVIFIHAASMLKRKDPEGVPNRCSAVFAFVRISVFVNNGSKSEPVCMDLILGHLQKPCIFWGAASPHGYLG